MNASRLLRRPSWLEFSRRSEWTCNLESPTAFRFPNQLPNGAVYRRYWGANLLLARPALLVDYLRAPNTLQGEWDGRTGG